MRCYISSLYNATTLNQGLQIVCCCFLFLFFPFFSISLYHNSWIKIFMKIPSYKLLSNFPPFQRQNNSQTWHNCQQAFILFSPSLPISTFELWRSLNEIMMIHVTLDSVFSFKMPQVISELQFHLKHFNSTACYSMPLNRILLNRIKTVRPSNYYARLKICDY